MASDLSPEAMKDLSEVAYDRYVVTCHAIFASYHSLGKPALGAIYMPAGILAVSGTSLFDFI
jgi:hypothetical protein